jgi:tetratricopeptide (TPR) repeat protein
LEVKIAVNTISTKGLLFLLVTITITTAQGWSEMASQPFAKQQTNQKQALFEKFDSPPVSEKTNKQAEELIQKEVLAENWEGIIQMLANVKNLNLPVEYRMIKGHACLATNRNNESLELFASVLTKPDLEKWQLWTDHFGTRNPNHAIAMYFKGDAHARQKEWKKADQCFSKALELAPQCYLAWNARGVISHAVGNTIMARSYFLQATKIKEDFSDAYASRGVLNVYQSSAKGAAEYFKSAVQLTQDAHCALFEIGLGCSSYGFYRYDEAKRFFNAVPENSALSPLAKRNFFATEIAALQQTVNNTSNTGMALESFILDSPLGQLALLQGIDSIGDIFYSLILQDGSRIPLSSGRLKAPPQGPPGGGVKSNSFYDGDEPEVQEGDGYRMVIFKKDGRIYMVVIEVMVNGKWKRLSLSPETYQMILKLLRQGKKITLKVQVVEGITIVIIYADGKAVWEVHYGPDGNPIWQGPPRQKQGPSPGSKSRSQGINSDILGLETTDYLPDLIAGIVFVQKHIEKEIMKHLRSDTTIDPTRKANLTVGGVDSDIRRVRANRGQWSASTVYGLLYPVPRKNLRP